jgi:hypothetical protein
MDGIWIEVILIGVAIVANGFFAGSELALVLGPPEPPRRAARQGVLGRRGGGSAQA